jgi:hypothetical protein
MRVARRLELLQWAARVGAVTAASLAEREGASIVAARSRLVAAERAGLLRRWRPLAGRPALYTPTREGLRTAGVYGQSLARVTPASAAHTLACAFAAAALARRYPDHEVYGEGWLRREEQRLGRPLASAVVARAPDVVVHRPDLVLWPLMGGGLPVAVELELTLKSQRRLHAICLAWARCRCVAGVLYVAAPAVRVPLTRAIERAQAGDRVLVVALDALTDGESHSRAGLNHPRRCVA